VINSYYNMVFMIYKTGVINGCLKLNLIHQNARSYPSVEIWTKAIRMILHLITILFLERVDQMRDLGVLIDERIEDLQKVQKRATRLLPKLKGFKYCDRLKACKLPTLHYRRLRGDMIETFKIVSGKYDRCAAPILTGLHSSVTRGHDLRLEKFRARYDLHKYFLNK